MVENPGGPFQKHHREPDENEIEMDVDENPDEDEDSYPESEEFKSIDNQLDMLNSVLDNLEQKNDNILAELATLLTENREIRKQLQECRVNEDENVDAPQKNN